MLRIYRHRGNTLGDLHVEPFVYPTSCNAIDILDILLIDVRKLHGYITQMGIDLFQLGVEDVSRHHRVDGLLLEYHGLTLDVARPFPDRCWFQDRDFCHSFLVQSDKMRSYIVSTACGIWLWMSTQNGLEPGLPIIPHVVWVSVQDIPDTVRA